MARPCIISLLLSLSMFAACESTPKGADHSTSDFDVGLPLESPSWLVTGWFPAPHLRNTADTRTDNECTEPGACEYFYSVVALQQTTSCSLRDITQTDYSEALRNVFDFKACGWKLDCLGHSSSGATARLTAAVVTKGPYRCALLRYSQGTESCQCVLYFRWKGGLKAAQAMMRDAD